MSDLFFFALAVVSFVLGHVIGKGRGLEQQIETKECCELICRGWRSKKCCDGRCRAHCLTMCRCEQTPDVMTDDAFERAVVRMEKVRADRMRKRGSK